MSTPRPVSADHRAIDEQIAERRADQAFMKRLQERHERDRKVFEKLRDS